MDKLTVIPIPSICVGVVSRVKDSHIEVKLLDTPVGPTLGAVSCQYVIPKGVSRYKIGDRVSVMVYFVYNVEYGRYMDLMPGMKMTVLGHASMPVFNDREGGNPTTSDKDTDDGVESWTHSINGAGTIVYRGGRVTTGTSGVAHSDMTVGGEGSYRDRKWDNAGNHYRFVQDEFLNACIEHFGHDAGSGLSLEDSHMAFRRYVASNPDLEKFTSVCEGSFNPLMGPNNMSQREISDDKDVVYSRTMQNGEYRVTIESGSNDDTMFNIRLDKVHQGEMKMPNGKLAPALLGNVVNLTMGIDGEFSVRAGGSGAPSTMDHKMVIDYADGKLGVQSSDDILLSHGDGAEEVNSISISASNGVDIKAKNGFRVNGKSLLTEDFLAWFDQNKSALCQVTQIGGPAPLFPAAQAGFTKGAKSLQSKGGFTTDDKGPAAKGANIKTDSFRSV